MSRVRNISLAEQTLEAILDSEFVQSLQEARKSSELELSNQYSIEDSFSDDREETINDYIFNCGYTRKEAINAYNKTIEDERQY
tara:strand:+ start:980 stop:1231 length:252 start_codon:yes stop_codon:yes gene_type:complete